MLLVCASVSTGTSTDLCIHGKVYRVPLNLCVVLLLLADLERLAFASYDSSCIGRQTIQRLHAFILDYLIKAERILCPVQRIAGFRHGCHHCHCQTF